MKRIPNISGFLACIPILKDNGIIPIKTACHPNAKDSLIYFFDSQDDIRAYWVPYVDVLAIYDEPSITTKEFKATLKITEIQ